MRSSELHFSSGGFSVWTASMPEACSSLWKYLPPPSPIFPTHSSKCKFLHRKMKKNEQQNWKKINFSQYSCCFILSQYTRILLFQTFMKNITVLYNNNLKLQFVITTLQHFDDYYKKLFLKGTVMFTLCSVPRDSFICRLVNQNLPPDESFSFNSKKTN